VSYSFEGDILKPLSFYQFV